MPPSAQTAGGRRVTRWSREEIVEKIREWNDRYGEPPCSADWNPSLARWRAQEWRAERYRQGEWPSTNAVKRPFDGSFSAAVRAAGLEPHRSGPRRRAAFAAGPAVDQRAPAAPRGVDEALLDAQARVAAAEARADAAERRALCAERRADRAEATAGEARKRARRATEQAGRARRSRDRVRAGGSQLTQTAEVAVAEAHARVRAASDQAAAAARDATDARRTTRAALERAAEAEARAATAARLQAAAQAALASEGTGAAWQAARAAEARAAEAETRTRELASLVVGEPRRLTAAELQRLRAGGPSGPSVLAQALRELGRARAAGDRAGLAAALGAVASAAVRWTDSL